MFKKYDTLINNLISKMSLREKIGQLNQVRGPVDEQTFIALKDAIKNGDKNVYYIDGYSFFPSDCRRDCTVDGCHPNDLGFYFMAQKIGGVLKEVIFTE